MHDGFCRWRWRRSSRRESSRGVRAVSDDFDLSTVTWAMDEESLGFLCEAIEQCDLVVADLETTGLDEHAVSGGATNGGYPARVALASFTLPTDVVHLGTPTTWVLPLSHPDSPWSGKWRMTLRRVALAIQEADRPISNHNVKFDARWVYAYTWVDLSRQIVWDTQMSSHLLDENSSTKLKERAPQTFGVPPWDEFDLSKPGAAERVPLFDLGLYAARDTYWTWRLHEYHRTAMFLGEFVDERPEAPEEIESARLGRLAVWCAMPTTATLTAIEQRGFLLDTDWTQGELADHRAHAAKLTVELSEKYHMNP